MTWTAHPDGTWTAEHATIRLRHDGTYRFDVWFADGSRIGYWAATLEAAKEGAERDWERWGTKEQL